MVRGSQMEEEEEEEGREGNDLLQALLPAFRSLEEERFRTRVQGRLEMVMWLHLGRWRSQDPRGLQEVVSSKLAALGRLLFRHAGAFLGDSAAHAGTI